MSKRVIVRFATICPKPIAPKFWNAKSGNSQGASQPAAVDPFNYSQLCRVVEPPLAGDGDRQSAERLGRS